MGLNTLTISILSVRVRADPQGSYSSFVPASVHPSCGGAQVSFDDVIKCYPGRL
jgi:hypothetical protein